VLIGLCAGVVAIVKKYHQHVVRLHSPQANNGIIYHKHAYLCLVVIV